MPKKKSATTTTQPSSVMLMSGAVLVVLGVIAYMLVQMKILGGNTGSVSQGVGLEPSQMPMGLAGLFGKKKPTPTAVPLPTPVLLPTLPPRPLPSGPQEYSMMLSEKHVGPRFAKGQVSSYVTQPGKTQTVAVYFEAAAPAESVATELVTDTKKTPIQMKLIGMEGNFQKWQGEWQLQDTAEKTFSFVFVAKDAKNQSQAAIGER